MGQRFRVSSTPMLRSIASGSSQTAEGECWLRTWCGAHCRRCRSSCRSECGAGQSLAEHDCAIKLESRRGGKGGREREREGGCSDKHAASHSVAVRCCECELRDSSLTSLHR